MFRTFARPLVMLVLMATLGISILAAQTGTGRVSGQVSDPDGASIPGATVQIVNQDTLATRTVTTDQTGQYIFLGLPAGRYQIIVVAKGFSRRASAVVTLTGEKSVVFNAQIAVSADVQQIDVSGGAPTSVEANTGTI